MYIYKFYFFVSLQFVRTLPDVCSKFIACYGIAVILDPLLIFIVDLGYHNYECQKKSEICQADYTAKDCTCFNGDFIKLYYRMMITEGSGITGIILILLIYFGCFVISSVLVYEYLVYVHKDARILDLWRRVKGPADEFFIPGMLVHFHMYVHVCACIYVHLYVYIYACMFI
jgi:hypothetical protein